MDKETPKDYDQPVAYDSEGRPLYAHPPKKEQSVVHVSRPVNPEKPVVSDEIQERHNQSVLQHPDLNISETEYVIMTVKRHPIALVAPLAVGVLLIGFAASLLFNYDIIASNLGFMGASAQTSTVILPVSLFSLFVGLGMYISYFIYANNRFHLTNESVIQNIQYSLFAHREQTVSLGDIEDASFTQHGIFQYLLNYGTIRLSTQGDEQTYTFPYVRNPKFEIAQLNNAVEAFKNGRPVAE